MATVFGDSANGEGVVATGLTGVKATGTITGVKAEGGIGIDALGNGRPAGVFSRHFEGSPLPQIHIKPQPMFAQNPEVIDPEDLIALDPDKVSDLPAFAEAGDLLATVQRFGAVDDIPPNAPAMLWFCVVSGHSEAGPAIWKQVLLGPSVEGKNKGKG